MGKIKIAPSQRKAAKGGKSFMKMVDASIKVGSSVTKQVKKGYKKNTPKYSTSTNQGMGCALMIALIIPSIIALILFSIK